MSLHVTPHVARALHASRVLKFGAALVFLSSVVFGARPQPATVLAYETGEPAAQTAAGSDHTIYLPFARGSVQAAPTPQPTPQPTPNPGPQTSAFFVEPEKKTSRPGIAIDPQGGMHMAYRYHVPYAEHPQVVYAYCPPPTAQCGDPAKWGRVAFLDRAEEVQIELTPEGKPRLLALMGEGGEYSGSLFVYLECNDNCLKEESWSAIGVQTKKDVLGSVLNYYTPRRYFELDPQGRPRFVYYDYHYQIEPDHIGGFYLWCDANCTQEGSWYETRFTRQTGTDYVIESESLTDPVLKFTRDGKPRILTYYSPLGNGAPGTQFQSNLYYLGCDNGCESPDNWWRVKLIGRGSGYEPAWDLELDPATDNPRAVSYQSGERKLFYHSCDANCEDASGWQTVSMREDGWGVGVDLELDAQGRPRMAFLNSSKGVGAMFCNAGCTTSTNWGERLIESKDDLDKAYPVARPVTCNNGLWYVYAPSLVFDAQSNPHIIYDAEYQARCQYVDPTQPAPPTDVFHEIWHSVRYVALR